MKLSYTDFGNADALAIFFNSLGGALSVSIAQNIFSNSLAQQIPKHTTGVDPQLIIGAGATHVREASPPGQLAGVLLAYNEAVTRALILPIAVGGLAFICSLFVSISNFTILSSPEKEVTDCGITDGDEKRQRQKAHGCRRSVGVSESFAGVNTRRLLVIRQLQASHRMVLIAIYHKT